MEDFVLLDKAERVTEKDKAPKIEAYDDTNDKIRINKMVKGSQGVRDFFKATKEKKYKQGQ